MAGHTTQAQLAADWARQYIPRHLLTEMLCLAAYFQEYPLLGYYAVDTRRSIGVASPTDHIPTEITVSPSEIEIFQSCDFALGAAFVYIAQRYALYYPPSPLPPCMPGYTHMPISPSDPLYAQVPRFAPCLPGCEWKMSVAELEEFAIRSKRPGISDKDAFLSDVIPTPLFCDFRELAPSHAWCECIVGYLRAGANAGFFLEKTPTNMTTMQAPFRHTLINTIVHTAHERRISTQLPRPEPGQVSRNELIAQLETMHAFWDQVVVADLPHAEFFVALAEHRDDQKLMIPEELRFLPKYLGEIIDTWEMNQQFMTIDKEYPQFWRPWLPKWPLKMLTVEQKNASENMEQAWLQQFILED